MSLQDQLQPGTAQAADGLDPLEIRAPSVADGMRVSRLVAQCPPLDHNSDYCYLLQCSHFSQTSVVAEAGGALVGFVSGYRPPTSPQALFVWQVAVAESARGRGLGRDMILHILSRPGNQDITQVLATVTAGNDASKAVFAHVARVFDASVTHSPLFDRDLHFAGTHESELLVRIGPFSRADRQERIAV